MRLHRRPPPVPHVNSEPTKIRRRPSDEREAEIAMLRFLLDSMKKRHAWDRLKGAVATAIPIFWIVLIVSRPFVPPALSDAFPAWIVSSVQPLLEQTPAVWTVAVSLAIAGFQWYNIAYYQRRVIPLVRDMYEHALTRRDPRLLTMLGEALRFRTLRESVRNWWHRLIPD